MVSKEQKEKIVRKWLMGVNSPPEILQTNNSMQIFSIDYSIEALYPDKKTLLQETDALTEELYYPFLIALRSEEIYPFDYSKFDDDEELQELRKNREHFDLFKTIIIIALKEIGKKKNFIPGEAKFYLVGRNTLKSEGADWEANAILPFPDLEGFYYNDGVVNEFFKYMSNDFKIVGYPAWQGRFALFLFMRLCRNYKDKIIVHKREASLIDAQDGYY